jgi:Nucleotidyl transferase AbiEii toxin, Type IV TA system
MDEKLLERIFRALHQEHVRYAVFGGVALNLHGIVRTTEDLDIFIEPSEENILRLKDALRSVFADPAIEEISASDLLGDYPAVAYVPPDGPFHIDILTRLDEAFRFEDLQTQKTEFKGVPVPVVTPRMLHLMKRDIVRPKDRGDAEELRRKFGFGEKD